MNLILTESEQQFRTEVQNFLKDNLNADILNASLATTGVFAEKELALTWQKKLAKKGWAAQLWPEEYGGIRWSQIQKYIFEVESAKAGAPMLIPLGLKMVAPVIIKFGTEEQKERFLPGILSGDDYWCQGYSEPGSGSDLASLSCRAEIDGDDYLVNGSKTWTTHAHYANWIFCLVRTNKEVKPQAGISFLLIPMDSPGITIRPIISISGQHDLNEVFFDSVRVSRANLIGNPGEGWTCAKHLLTLERGAGAASARLRATYIRLLTLASNEPDGNGDVLLDNQLIQHQFIELDGAITGLEYTELRAQKSIIESRDNGTEPSLLKTEATEIEQTLSALAVNLVGPEGLVLIRNIEDCQWPTPLQPDSQWSVPRYLNCRAASIYAGTNEIQRNLIARSILTAS
ncbi:MAG: acyl-CoA dehydrogenase [Shewanella sp.]|jgi:acyl-CoA dehydrogenase